MLMLCTVGSARAVLLQVPVPVAAAAAAAADVS